MSHTFEIKREVVLEATPEEVFAAVTTGIAGWMFPVDVDPGAAAPGAPTINMDSDPPNRFAVRVENESVVLNALEYVIEARDGGTAVLRYVHSGIFGEDWENQYDSAGKHTDFYLHSLGQYVKYFPGRDAAYVAIEGPAASSAADGLDVLKSALGLNETSTAGDPVRLDLPGLGTVETVLDYVNPYFVGLRSADALYRFYGRNNFGGTVDLAHHLFAAGVDQAKAEQAWRGWLDGVYA